MKSLKKILTGIWKFLNSKFFTIAVIVILLMIGTGECKRILNLKRDINTHEQNISALTDSLKFEKTKKGALLVSIDGYIASEKELKKLNTDLWQQVNDQKGKVITLSNVVIRLKQDSTELAKNVDKLKTYIGELVKIDTNHFEAPWVLAEKYDDNNFFSVTGRTRIGVLHQNPLYLVHDTTYMTGFENQIDLTWGEKVEKGKLRIFVESTFPGFTVKSMEGVLIDPNTNPLFKDLMKKKHWFNGWSVGLGITPGIDLVNQSKFGITVGPTFTWNIYTR